MSGGKKYNPLKGQLAMVRAALKNVGVWRSVQKQKKESCALVNYKTCKQLPLGDSTAKAIIKLRHKWSIHIMVTGYNGIDHYMKSEVIHCKNPMYQAELAEYLDKEHKEFARREMNPDHWTDMCWLAVPNGDELNEDQLAELINKLGVWNEHI